MRLLLDTHALLWWLGNDPSLLPAARTAIADGGNQVFVSAVSAWEISIKQAAGKLKVPDDLEFQIARHDFMPLLISIGHAMTAGRLPQHHRDPFDRMLVAQALTDDLTIVTRDRHIPKYEPRVLEA